MSDFKGYNKLQIGMLELNLTSQLMIENAGKDCLTSYELRSQSIDKIKEIERQLADIRNITYSTDNIVEY